MRAPACICTSRFTQIRSISLMNEALYARTLMLVASCNHSGILSPSTPHACYARFSIKSVLNSGQNTARNLKVFFILSKYSAKTVAQALPQTLAEKRAKRA